MVCSHWHLGTKAGEETGLREGQWEKERILECFSTLKNVPASCTFMYVIYAAGMRGSLSVLR